MIVLHPHSHMFGSLFCQMLLLEQMLECLGATFSYLQVLSFPGQLPMLSPTVQSCAQMDAHAYSLQGT